MPGLAVAPLSFIENKIYPYNSQKEVIFSETLDDNIAILGSYPLRTEYANRAK